MLEKFSSPLYRKQNSRVIIFGDGKARQIRHGIGAALGDQQAHIAYFKHFAYF
jgi:hypothetical protein